MEVCIVLIPMMIFVFVFFAVLKPLVSAGGNFDKLVAGGIPAQGILLAVQSTPTMRSGTGTRTFQRRQVQIDVEIPGHPPYVMDASIFIPSNLVRDVLPGATVELRIDPKNRNNVAIVGPGVAFSAANFLAQASGGAR